MRLRRCALQLGVVWMLAPSLVLTANAAGPVDIYDAGDHHESIGQADEKTPLSPGVTYEASAFPIDVRVKATDPLWGAVQLRGGRFRFVQFHHLRSGKLPLHGWGYLTLSAAIGPTSSVAQTAAKLHDTPGLDAGPLRPARVAGFRGKSFDAEVIGEESGDPGISLTPFTKPLHCGWCTRTMHGETLDNKFAGKGQLFRIMVIGVRGKTVVIYIESSFGGSSSRKHPPAETFPTFLPFAQRLLSTLAFPS